MKRKLFRTSIILGYIVLLFIIIIPIIKIVNNKIELENYVSISSTNRYYSKPLIYIPGINLKQIISSSKTDFSNLDSSIVYYKNINPNKGIVLFGHSGAGYGTFFNRIDELKINDKAYLLYEDKYYEYEFLSKKEITKYDTYVLNNINNVNKMYLVTCIKNNSNNRLLVELKLKDAKILKK